MSDISLDTTWTLLRKRKAYVRETETYLRAPENTPMRTDHIKASIDETQQKSGCRLWGDSDKTINHINKGMQQISTESL